MTPMFLSSSVKKNSEGVRAVALTPSPTIEKRRRLVKGKAAGLLWAFLSLVGLLYLATSLRVMASAFFWLPVMPDVYYLFEGLLYRPFGLYFDGAYALLGRAIPSYQLYAVVVRAPFLVLPLVVWVLAVRRLRCRF